MGSMLHSFGIRPTSRHRGGPGRAGAGLVDLVHVCEPWTRLPPGHAWFPLGALWAWQHGDRCEDTTVVADSEVESECPI